MNRHFSMIIPPHIFSKIQRETLFTNTSFCSKSSFQISPESFKAIYMITLLVRVLTLAMLYKTMYIAFSSNSRIALPRIRAYRGTPLHTLLYKRYQGLCLYIRHNLCPYLSSPTQDTKHRCLLSSSASLCKTDSLRFPFVFPLSSQIRFIDLNCSSKYSRNIFCHYLSDYQQRPQYSLSFKSCFLSSIITGKSLKKRHHQRVPLRFRQSKGKTVRFPFVFASQATPLEPAYYIGLCIIASRTSMSFCHATNVSYLVA
jgi:hypothetical protein